MSLIDPDLLADQQLITQYILECRGRGHFLPYKDYEIIRHWLTLCPDANRLLLLLSEILPQHFERFRDQPFPPGLQSVDRQVTRCLSQRRPGSGKVETRSLDPS